jgi:hypothetical protein
MGSLDLSGSQQLRIVELKAPNLTHLNLQGCRSLNDCHIECPNLEHVNVEDSRTFALRFSRNIRQVIMKNWANHSETQTDDLTIVRIC